MRVLICGGGSGAHTAAGIAATQPGVYTRVLTLYSDESLRWQGAMSRNPFQTVLNITPDEEPLILWAGTFHVSNDPKEVAPDSDIIIMTVPAYTHEIYLQALKPYIKPGAVLVGLPGQSGFEFEVNAVLGEVAKDCTMLVFESRPWVCRLHEYGKKVEVLGVKKSLVGALKQGSSPPNEDPISMLQKALGHYCVFEELGHTLGATLMAMDGIGHPAIMYGHWKDWDGEPFDEPPPIFTNLDEESAELLASISNEVLAIKDAITKQRPDVDLSNVCHIYIWFLRCYSNYISDRTDLRACFHTNWAFQNLTHFTESTSDGKYVPNFHERYLSEDVPYGLVVIRGIAEIVDVQTPNIDKVLLWAQEKLNQEYLVNGKLTGKDVGKSRAPQRYGFSTLDEVVGPALSFVTGADEIS